MRNRLAVVAVLAVVLALADIAVKLLIPTEPWLFHRRSHGWLALSIALLCLAVAFARLPSRFLALASGILAGGVLGNLVSAGWDNGRVANPFVISNGADGVAFNLADVFVLVGIVLWMAALIELTIHYRRLLPQSTVVVRLARQIRARAARQPESGGGRSR